MKIGFHHTRSMSSWACKARIVLFSLLAITAITANTAHALECTPSLYGTSYSGKNDPAIFNSINLANGTGQRIGPTGFNRISAMDVDPTSGILYAVAERPSDRQKVLISIDRETGAGTQIAELTFGDDLDHENIAGMSFDSSGTLYGYGSWDQGFYTIDVSAGTITRLGLNDLGNVGGNALAFSPDDILYHVGDEDLNTVNLTTGLPSLVTALTFNFVVDPYGVTAMDYAPETGFYYALVKDGSDGERNLATINVTTGEVDRIGFTSDNMDGMAYVCESGIIVDPLPPAPEQVDASDGTFTDKIVITWSSVSGATAYNVYYSLSLESSKTLFGQYAENSAVASGGEPGVIWYFWVYSVNANGESATGTYDTGYTQSVVLEPTDLAITIFDAVEGTYTPEDDLVVEVKIENVGGTVSDPYRLNFYASTNTTITTEDNYLGYVDYDALAAGESSHSDITLPTPFDSIANGSYYIGGILDIDDADNSNNSKYDPTAITISSASITVPDAPTLISVEPGDGGAVLRFRANGNGGSAITDYTAKCGTFTQNGASSPIAVSGLTNGLTYSCSVVATNSIGDSASSASLAVTPNTDSPLFQINAGLNDAWYYPVTAGQGFYINVFPEIGYVSLSWFTYDTERPDESVTANLGDPGHRWLMALGTYSGNQAVMDISITSGGIFDTATTVTEVKDGKIVLTFTDCETGTIDYDIPSINQQGTVPIQRVVGDNIALCESISEQVAVQKINPKQQTDDTFISSFNDPLSTVEATPLVNMNAGLNDAWYYPVTNGQGFFITVFPDIGYVSLAWFTYDTVRPADDVTANLQEPGHRWLNALGTYSGNQAVMDITIASGGIFDTAMEITEVNDGTIILTFTDCESGVVEYDIPSINQTGTVPIQRIVSDNISLCEALDAD